MIKGYHIKKRYHKQNRTLHELVKSYCCWLTTGCWMHFMKHRNTLIDGILPKRPYPPCLPMADRAFLAGYPRFTFSIFSPTLWCASNWNPFSSLNRDCLSWSITWLLMTASSQGIGDHHIAVVILENSGFSTNSVNTMRPRQNFCNFQKHFLN